MVAAVETKNNGMEALELLRQRQEMGQQFDLVLSDVHMPDMDGFKLLEAIGLELGLPVIMMSSDGDTNVVLRGVTHGAVDFLIKPVRIEELRNVWQHVVRRRSVQFSRPGDETDGDSRTYGSGGHGHGMKRKDTETLRVEHEGGGAGKKPRVIWSVEMHQQFVNAVNYLGIDKAVPKRILELMNVEGLTRENVASHLQKYRLYLKRVEGVQAGKNGKMPKPPAVEAASKEFREQPQPHLHDAQQVAATATAAAVAAAAGYHSGFNAAAAAYHRLGGANPSIHAPGDSWHHPSSPMALAGYGPESAGNFEDVHAGLGGYPNSEYRHHISSFTQATNASQPSENVQMYSAFSSALASPTRPDGQRSGQPSSSMANIGADASQNHAVHVRHSVDPISHSSNLSPTAHHPQQHQGSNIDMSGHGSSGNGNGNTSTHGSNFNGSSGHALIGTNRHGMHHRSHHNIQQQQQQQQQSNNDDGAFGPETSRSTSNAAMGTDRDTPSEARVPSPVLHDNPNHFAGAYFDKAEEETMADTRSTGEQQLRYVSSRNDTNLGTNEAIAATAKGGLHASLHGMNGYGYGQSYYQANEGAFHSDPSLLPSLANEGLLQQEMEGIQGMAGDGPQTKDDPEGEFINLLIQGITGMPTGADAMQQYDQQYNHPAGHPADAASGKSSEDRARDV